MFPNKLVQGRARCHRIMATILTIGNSMHGGQSPTSTADRLFQKDTATVFAASSLYLLLMIRFLDC